MNSIQSGFRIVCIVILAMSFVLIFGSENRIGIASLRANVGLAAAGIVVGTYLLVRAFKYGARGMRDLIVVYLYGAVMWGSVYYLIYLYKPSSFAFDEAVQRPAVVEIAEQAHDRIVEALNSIRVLDAAVIALAASPEHVVADRIKNHVFDFDVEANGHWQVSRQNVVRWRGQVLPPDVYVYVAFVPVGEKGRKGFGVRLQDAPSEVSSALFVRSMINICVSERRKYLDGIKVDIAAPDVEMRTQFALLDFFYFAVMAPGADIIKPATSLMRFLVLVQFLTVTSFALRQVAPEAR